MTRRERMEAKLEKREKWAAGRREKAAGLFKRNEPFRGDHAFNTQPGHIPERARVIRREDAAFGHLNAASHHEEKASGLAAQLETSVFSDDSDAVERLQERIAEREAKRDRYKAYNATCRAAAKEGREHGDLSILDESQRSELLSCMRTGQVRSGKGGPFPGYVLSNLGATIRTDQERIKMIEARAARTAEAEAAGGVLVRRIPEHNLCVVTFAEKPSRAILQALRDADYYWTGGSWQGSLAKLPEGIGGD